MISEQDNSSFPNRTMRRFQARQCVVSTQDNVSFAQGHVPIPQRTCVVSKQDIVLFTNRTMCRVHSGDVQNRILVGSILACP